ncbi:MAG: flagellar hook-associated protein FlgK [Alphaproteobacteria bacterium]|nr:flagellar hook-associated protein FlgK [Alphaproteobacteria bacterium]
MSSALDTALTGLRVAQQQISIISTNVSNVGTPGYSRKILPQNTQTINGQAIGVLPGNTIRNVNLNLTRDLWTRVSSVGQLEIQETYLQRIEQFHGPPDKEISIAAEISKLKDSFAVLSDSPEDPFLQTSVVNQAIDTANKINDLSNLITTLRNDVQDELVSTVNNINSLLTQIADLNVQIEANTNGNRPTADLEDQRDQAIKDLSSLIEISYFKRGNGTLVIQTASGVELTSNKERQLTFAPTLQSAITYYPPSASGVYVGDPETDPDGAIDITQLSPGGKLGGLLDLRDRTFPKQTAQIDELAHKLALRFDNQGLRLFTNKSGGIPADTPPDPTTTPNPTPVTYVGFAASIQVNQNIIDDPSLLQKGTYGAILDAGDNEVLRRIIEFAFGDTEYQEAYNADTATQVDLLNRGGADLQTWLGLHSSNTLLGGRDLTPFADVNALITSANGALDPANDTFRITFEEARTGLGPASIDISMAAAALQAGATAADQIVAEINAQIAALPVPAGLTATASVGSNGEIRIDTRGSIVIDSTNPANPMGQTGLTFLGLSDNTGNPIAPTDPYFDIQVGNNDPTRIYLEPGDTHTDLLTKLGAVESLAVDTANFALDGLLRLRPGNSYAGPDFGGDLKITGGPFETSGATYGAPPATTARASIDNNVNIISALFGTYTSSGGVITDNTPITNVPYTSETDGSLASPIPTVPFRTSLLGPGANVSINIVGVKTLIDFGQKIVNENTQELSFVARRAEDDKALKDVLETQVNNESGVNIDEELGHLIVVQTAYSASAQVLNAVEELFQLLLSTIRR